MDILRKAPISIAIATAIALSGCLGGGGGGSSSNGGAGGGGDTPPANDTTNYTLTIETPEQQPLTTQAHTSNTERLLSAVIDALVPSAFAQAVGDLLPEAFRVEIINGDDNGTPDDPSDDKNQVLLGGEDFDVERDGDSYVLGLPFTPQVNSFIGVEVAPGMEFSVLTHAESLVANPVTTFITRVISSYAGQLDEMTLDELNELIEEVNELAADDRIQNAILTAYATSDDTEELLAVVATQLAATIEAKVDEAVTPPLPADTASQTAGDYHFIGLSVGVFSNTTGGGLFVGGHTSNATLSIDTNTATLRPTGSTLEFEAVHPYSAPAVVRAEQLEDEANSVAIDSRGLISSESESVGAYEKGSFDVESCEASSAACQDRDYTSANRMLAAGPAEAPFNTLIGSSYNDREVSTADGITQLKVVAGFIDLGVRRPTSPIQLDGKYGTLEYTVQVEDDDPNLLDFEAWLVEMDYGSTHVSYCNTANLDLEINTNTLAHQFERMDQEDGNCLHDQGQRQYFLTNEGELTIPQPTGPAIEGVVSADGLTILMAAQDPDEDDLIDGYAEVNEGERATLISVKLDEELESLAGRRYRLFSQGLDARMLTAGRLAGMNRFLMGTLEYDADGNAHVQVSAQGELAARTGQRVGVNNLQQSFTTPAANSTLNQGRLSTATTFQGAEGVTFNLRLDGYVQEGGRVLLLNRHLDYGSGHILGPAIAVCMNCE